MTDRFNLSAFTFEQLEWAYSVLAVIPELHELLEELQTGLYEELESRVQLRKVEERPS